MKLALFDLDHTLLPFDSGMAWTRFLVERGVLPAPAEQTYLDTCRQYVAGRLGIEAVHRASVAPLVRFARPLLAQWAAEFERVIRERAPADMRALVHRHQAAGDVCAIVTATTRLIAEPCARAFGVTEVLATEAATADGTPGGALTGEIDGAPCFREHKLARVRQWLTESAPGGVAELAGFDASWFYSDSISDLPLLQAVSNPVAVRPQERLRRHALAAGWPVLFDPV